MVGKVAVSPAEVAQLLVRIGAVEVRPDPEDWFTWTSGRRAPVYCDNRILMGFPAERQRIADALVEAVRASQPDVEVIAGTATAGIPHAAWVAERMRLPMVYVRASAKRHGKQKRVEGASLSGERVVVIEDLMSTGGSAADSVDALREEGGKVVGVQAIVSYGLPAAERRFEPLGVPIAALTDYDAILALLDLDEVRLRVLREWRES
jgi:orotate phosphoribosyltransferase